MSDAPLETDDRAFSEVLEAIGARPDLKMKLEELVHAFGERGFGAMFLFLGLLSAVIGFIPGSTTILGIPIFLLGLQLIARRDEPWLPRAILEREIDRADYASGVSKALGPLRRVERFSSPRLEFLSADWHEALMGLACVIMALILMLPLIGFNLFPSLAVAILGFGMMQRDGVVMLAGWVVCAGFWTFCWLMWEVVSRTLHHGWTWATSLFG